MQRMKNFFKSEFHLFSDSTRKNIGMAVTAGHTALAAQETVLLYLILNGTSPEFMFPYLVGTMIVNNGLSPWTTKRVGEFCVKGIGNTVISTTAALLALNPFKGTPKAAMAFDVALGSSSIATIVSQISKYVNNEFEGLEAAGAATNVIKNALIGMVITMGKNFGEISPGEIFEILKEKLSYDMKTVVLLADASALAAATMSLIIFTRGLLFKCYPDSENGVVINDYYQLLPDDEKKAISAAPAVVNEDEKSINVVIDSDEKLQEKVVEGSKLRM